MGVDALGSVNPYFPASQRLHTLLPGGLNLPTSQGMHVALVLVSSAGAYLPDGQSLEQDETLTLPKDIENLPPGHHLHSAEPEEGWYLLASQEEQFLLVMSMALYFPGLQAVHAGNDPSSPEEQG